jgi:hypothetical protein
MPLSDGKVHLLKRVQSASSSIACSQPHRRGTSTSLKLQLPISKPNINMSQSLIALISSVLILPFLIFNKFWFQIPEARWCEGQRTDRGAGVPEYAVTPGHGSSVHHVAYETLSSSALSPERSMGYFVCCMSIQGIGSLCGHLIRLWSPLSIRVQRIWLFFIENDEYRPFDGCKIEI